MRHAYGPVTARDVAGLFDAGFLTGGKHALALGPTESIEYLKKQTRLTFARVGIIDPLSLDDYRAHGGYRGLANALKLTGEQIVATVTDSGLRGRGGAAFPTGIKWKTVLGAAGRPEVRRLQRRRRRLRHVRRSHDHGERSVRARRGHDDRRYRRRRDEGLRLYPRRVSASASGRCAPRSSARRPRASSATNIQGSGHAFHLEVREAAGAYICGEETSLLESLEGKRGMVRYRPPLPAIKGLFGKPTIINNVLSLSSVPVILDKGAEFYKNFGVGRSRGTITIQLAGNIKRGGLIELAFGVPLREILYDFGGGSATGKPIRAVQAGGPLGAYIHPKHFDTPFDYEQFAAVGAMVGHGGLVVFDDTRRHGRAGAVRDGVLRHRVLRQVHAVPHRRRARRRGHRQDPRRRQRDGERRRCCTTCATPWSRARCAHWAAWRRFPC